MAKTWVEQFTDQTALITSEARQLYKFANAHRTLGNRELAVQLEDIAENIIQATADIKTAISKKLDADLKGTYAMSGAVLGAALAGVELEKKNSGKKGV